MMQKQLRGDAAFARPFHSIRSVEFSPENTLSSNSFRPRAFRPLLQELADRLTEMLLREGKP